MSNIAKFPEKEDPHLSGDCQCLGCGHKWVATCPVGTYQLECPECHTMKGRTTYGAVRDRDHWECGCGNDLFLTTHDGNYCANCGMWQVYQ